MKLSARGDPMPEGYCRRYNWQMTARDVEKMGCLNREKQARHRRERCKFFEPKILTVSIGERIGAVN